MITCKDKNYKEMLLYPKDKLISFFNFNNKNQKDGSFKILYNSGQVFASGFYKAGKLNGNLKIYYPNSNIFASENYKNDVLQGYSSIFNFFGKKIIERKFKDGFIIQEFLINEDNSAALSSYQPKTRQLSNLDIIIYDKIGLKVEKVSPFDGILEGKQMRWSEFRLLSQIAEYKNDLPFGIMEGYKKQDAPAEIIFWDKKHRAHKLSSTINESRRDAFTKNINDTKRQLIAKVIKKNRVNNRLFSEILLKTYHFLAKTR